MGVWGAIANKMEASQETCVVVFVVKITQASLQIIKRYVPKEESFHTVICIRYFFESLFIEFGKKVH